MAATMFSAIGLTAGPHSRHVFLAIDGRLWHELIKIDRNDRTGRVDQRDSISHGMAARAR